MGVLNLDDRCVWVATLTYMELTEELFSLGVLFVSAVVGAAYVAFVYFSSLFSD
jgi:hypothetical protein